MSALSRVLRRILPWKVTGPASSPEYLSGVEIASTYRVVSPASQGTVHVPHAENDKVYDIKYHTRDVRRNHITYSKSYDNPVNPVDHKTAMAEEAKNGELDVGRVWMLNAHRRPMTDEPGGGYQ